MQNLLLALLYVVLNGGLYVLFLSPFRSRFDTVVKRSFVLVFMLSCILLQVLGGQSTEESDMTINLLIFHVMTYLLHRVALHFSEAGELKVSEKVLKKFFVYFSGAFTFFGTVVQLFTMFDMLT